MSTCRPPAVAGRFYPADRAACVSTIHRLHTIIPADEPPKASAGIVPHAGWMFSGALAVRSINAVLAAEPETIIILGAVHVNTRHNICLDGRAEWRTPLGVVPIDVTLSRQLEMSTLVHVDPAAHRHEHSIEVELPLIQLASPATQVLPLMVRPDAPIRQLGEILAEAIVAASRNVAILASTDLTHYGPAFGFEPHGAGWPGIHWARDVNDRSFVKVVQQMNSQGVIDEAQLNHNACGAGAVAAMVETCRHLGWTEFAELQHCVSADIARDDEPDPRNSVGYLAAAFRPPAA